MSHWVRVAFLFWGFARIVVAEPVFVETPSYFWSAPRRARVVTVGEQKPEKSRLLQVEDDEEWRTTVLFARPHLRAGKKGVILMIPGMGGNVAKYGVAASTSTFAGGALDVGYYPVAIQNEVYFGAANPSFPEAERWAIARRLQPLAVQMQSFNRRIRAVFSGDGEAWVYGRSNGAAQTLEWLHRACEGDLEAMATAERVDGVLVAGLNSHEDRAFRLWTHLEDVENAAHPDDVDEVATWLDRENYRQMAWASEGPAIVNPRMKKFPKVIAIISAQDHYVPVFLQVATMEAFSRRHPQIEVELIYAPVRHDPTASFTVLRGGVLTKVRTGRVLKEILQTSFTVGARSPGLHRRTLADYENAAECPGLLERAAEFSLTR